MTSIEQQFLQFWSNNAVRVAHWADSSYGPLEEKDILKLAQEMDFPLVHFHSSYDGGLTVKGCDNHAGNPIPKPADVVFIEMGYNDDSGLSAEKVAGKMRKQTWYKTLAEAASLVKFVVFLDQPTYRQACPPKSQKQLKKWVRGAIVEGSKFTEEAIQVCHELGISAFCLKASADELFAGMLTTDETGTIWQNEGTCLWEDSVHPTAAGAEVHFRSVVKAFRARCVDGDFAGKFAKSSLDTSSSAMRAPPWPNEVWNFQAVSWGRNHYARSKPY